MRIQLLSLVVLWFSAALTSGHPSSYGTGDEQTDFLSPTGLPNTTAYATVPTVDHRNDTYDFTLDDGARARNGKVICETSRASPTVEEIKYCFNALYQTPRCDQTNRFASKCTKLCSRKGGQISVCTSSTKAVNCIDVVWAAEQVLDQCLKPEIHRAGGYYKFDAKGWRGLRVVVH